MHGIESINPQVPTDMRESHNSNHVRHDTTNRGVSEEDEFFQHAMMASMALARRAGGGLQPIHHHQWNDQQYYYYHYYPDDETKFIGIIPWTFRIIKLCAFGLLLLFSSATCYGVFYWAVMPGNYASRPLFFDYTGTAPYPHLNVTFSTTPSSTKQEQQHTTLQTSCSPPSVVDADSCSTATASTTTIYYSYAPWATVDLFVREQAVVWGVETLHEEALPPPETTHRILQPGQPYYVELHLTLPETQLNRNVGMFGVGVDLLSDDTNGTTLRLASSVRPARLPHESGWVAVARKLVWLLPIIFGGVPESRSIVIPSFRHIVESQNYPLRHVVVRLVSQPQASKPYSVATTTTTTINDQSATPTTRPIEVIRGEVRIGKELNAFQEVLKEWFYTWYFVGTMMFFSLHTAIYGLVQYYWNQAEEDYGCYDGDDQPYYDPSLDDDFNNEDNNHRDDDFDSIHERDDNGSDMDSGSIDHAEGGRSEQNDNGPPGWGDEDDNSDDWEECPPENATAQSPPVDVTINARDIPRDPPSTRRRQRRTAASNRGQRQPDRSSTMPPRGNIGTIPNDTATHPRQSSFDNSNLQPNQPPTRRERKQSARGDQQSTTHPMPPETLVAPSDFSIPQSALQHPPPRNGETVIGRNERNRNLGTWVDSALEAANVQGMPPAITREEPNEDAEVFFDCWEEEDVPIDEGGESGSNEGCEEEHLPIDDDCESSSDASVSASLSASFDHNGCTPTVEQVETPSEPCRIVPPTGTRTASYSTVVPVVAPPVHSDSPGERSTIRQPSCETSSAAELQKGGEDACAWRGAQARSDSRGPSPDACPAGVPQSQQDACLPEKSAPTHTSLGGVPLDKVPTTAESTKDTNNNQQLPGEVSSSAVTVAKDDASIPKEAEVDVCAQQDSNRGDGKQQSVVKPEQVEGTLCDAVFRVPEAQILDSFLADLISPFVR
ncbi:Putative adipose-regulatory protein (Seipin) [Seminavis robusta]|uniref:Adipose-regulatory protein (Seipin) n=1 Tax=Seminavis robusta TaxID=568900 RepID=A0A9N8E1V3_9STRA|nr:Putative adipose-regulatory protein (Seipin) [Seminavis robusta]|eukprot:Sro562_g167140.1 Putative adipose-regulatory protein (Seipin) (949) ;mRNA; r:55197-58143